MKGFYYRVIHENVISANAMQLLNRDGGLLCVWI